MDHNAEYHDPDYAEASVCVKNEPPELSEEEKIDKIKHIIRREFRNELDIRESEVMLIDQRLTTTRRWLHQLRYTLVNNYYKDQKLLLSASQIEDEVAAQNEPRARAEVSSILRDSQMRLHPSVRKLLGKKSVDISEIFRSRAPRSKTKKDYNAMLQKRNYTIAADSTKSLRPETEPEVETKPVIEKPEEEQRPKKIPRQRDPRVQNVVTVDEVTRNQMKHRYRIIIGNTSKYAPSSSPADRSTHKWLLYVRGAPGTGGARAVLGAVTVRLHHSYAPHHQVHIAKPPFHVSRRGWGEFPAKVTLHFAQPHLNRPATITHTIKLDRHYTGLQTLGAETIVDVWLYSTPEMLEFEYKDDEETTANDIKTDEPDKQIETKIKDEPKETLETENSEIQNDSWLDFFKNTTEVNVDDMFIKNVKTESEDVNETAMETESVVNDIVNSNTEEIMSMDMIENGYQDHNESEVEKSTPKEVINKDKCKKRIMKYMDPTTRKIYYLEVDRDLDLSTVQEIVINSQGNVNTAKVSPYKNGLRQVRKKKMVSLLKPEVKMEICENRLEKMERFVTKSSVLSHIENDHCYLATSLRDPDEKIHLRVYEHFSEVISKLTCVRVIVNYLLRQIPLVSENARDPYYVQYFPFVVDCEEKYWRLDFAKRRNMEWSRAKLINKILCEKFKYDPGRVWRTKQILVFSRMHGFYPVRPESYRVEPENNDEQWSSWSDLESTRKSSNIRQMYPNESDLCTLSVFKSGDLVIKSEVESLNLCESDEEIDVLSEDLPVKVKKEVLPVKSDNLNVLPVNEEDRLRFLFIERKCADIGVELRNEDVGNGDSYSAVHSVLLSAAKCFAEEILRASLAQQTASRDDLPAIWTGSRTRPPIQLEHVYRAIACSPRLRSLANEGLGALPTKTYKL